MIFFPSTVINFHAVHNCKWMDNTLQLLRKVYKMVPIEDIEDYYFKRKSLKKVCHITFDDGDASFYHNVFPLLKKYNIPASIFVSPLVTKNNTNFWFQEISAYDMDIFEKIVKQIINEEVVDKSILSIPINSLLKKISLKLIWEAISIYQKQTHTSPKKALNLNVKQLLELHNSDLITIGAHTLNHPILQNETNEVAFKELTESIDELANLLKNEIHYFAYPNGVYHLDFDKREIDILKKTTIKLAFSTERKPISLNDDLFSIPRNGITKGSQSFIILKLLLGQRWDNLKRLVKGKLETDYRLV